MNLAELYLKLNAMEILGLLLLAVLIGVAGWVLRREQDLYRRSTRLRSSRRRTEWPPW